MTDLYIRPYDTPDVRRRVLFAAAGIVIFLLGAGFLFRKGCATEPNGDSAVEDVESDPLIDELLTLPESPDDETQVKLPEPLPGTDETPPGAYTGDRLLAIAQSARAQDDLLRAREAGLRILSASRSTTARGKAMTLLSEVNLELVSTPRSMPEKTEYTVKSGDTLDRLAKKYGTTVELIQKGNNIEDHRIYVGDRLRIFSGTFTISIDKSDNILDLYFNGKFFKRYDVGTGEHNRTPNGEFKITDRIYHPPWWRNGKVIPYGAPENELGTHWLSLDIKGYGIHGTWKPETIGKQASAGCVRLLNENIEELFALVPLGTAVTIAD
jgi:lipoprotein-anchoring transpeptidase ErfK/SrfK